MSNELPTTAINPREGHERLWLWFGLSRASFLTLPRVLLHGMPDEWQRKMAELLEQYEATYRNLPEIGTTVRAVAPDGRIVAMPEALKNYRHPDRAAIEGFK